jgi:hypothetical protein
LITAPFRNEVPETMMVALPIVTETGVTCVRTASGFYSVTAELPVAVLSATLVAVT